MIEVLDVTKKYGRVKAVDSLSFRVEKGEILGLLGPNGAGKTTTMNIVTGYIPATEGTVRVAGHDILDESAEVKKRIGYLPENPPLYLDMTVNEYLGFVTELKKVPRDKRKTDMDRVKAVTGIGDVGGRLIKNLSKGYRQRVGLAQALVGNPEVIVLDEPTIGLDPRQITEIRDLIKSLQKEHTVILSSHILSEVNMICDRVVIIHRGRLVATDTPQNLSASLHGTSRLLIRIEGEKDKVCGILGEVPGVKGIKPEGEREKGTMDYMVESEPGTDVRRGLFYRFSKEGMPILEMKPANLSLEEAFLQLTSDGGDR